MLQHLEFDSVEHAYRMGGRQLPSVTQILEGLRLTPPYPEDRGALDFGRAVHKCCELAANGRWNPTTTSPVLVPYVNGFMEKVREMNIRPIATELRVWDPIELYAGTMDLWCWIYDEEQAVIDLKTGVPPACVELQTAGYVTALRRLLASMDTTFPKVSKTIRRFSMQLLPDRAVNRECK